MRLLGVIDEKLLLQDENRFFVESNENIQKTFKNYNFLKNRDTVIGGNPITGEGVFNFRYGPITSGVREAGVFNIYTFGERILSVNIDLSYKKRNIEKLMINKTPQEGLTLAKAVATNFCVSHALAYTRAVEKAFDINVGKNTEKIRVIALELERIYNHIHLFGKLARGGAQQVLASHLEALYEDSLRINKELCGDRFLSNVIEIGYCKIKQQDFSKIKQKLLSIKEKLEELFEHALNSYNFVDRIYQTAVLEDKQAIEIGITGPSLRASGIKEDLRCFEPIYKDFHIQTQEDGDALSRLIVRIKEAIYSINLVIDLVNEIEPPDNIEIKDQIAKEAIGYAESPGGLVVYYLQFENNKIEQVYISTPSVFGFKAFCDTFAGHIFTDFSFAFDSFGINFADAAR